MWDNEVPEKLSSKIDNFPLIFKNTSVSKTDIRALMKNYTEEERLLSQPRKMLKSSFTIKNGTLITSLLLFQLQLGDLGTKKHRFVNPTSKSGSTHLCSQQWTEEGKVTKIQIQVSSQRQ